LQGRGSKFAQAGFLKDAQDIARGTGYCTTLTTLLAGADYNDSGITGKGAFKKYMDLEKQNNTIKLIDSRTSAVGPPVVVATPAATVAIGTTGVFDSTKATIFDGTTSAFKNVGTGAAEKQTLLEKMGNYCEDAYEFMKTYKEACADKQPSPNQANDNPKKDTWECKKALAMRMALNSYRFYHGTWAAYDAVTAANNKNNGTYRWFDLSATD